jgi:uncharacterized protein YciI
MFLLLGRYTAPADQVEPHRDAHVAWVQEHTEAGHFIAGALQTDGAGGLIVARTTSRPDIERWVADDPFIRNGVFEYDIREYEVAFTAPGLEALKD